jgi:serine/threonine protein kinase/tetratricopeptide (TPR) repeat protein
VDDPRWLQIQAIFHEALERPAPDREAFVAAAGAGDDALVREVHALLEEDARATSVLERHLPAAVSALLSADEAPGRLVDRRLGPYLLRSVLGEGGMGVVYLAERADLGRAVAIKVLRGVLSPMRAERFALEQRTLAQLNHPAIAQLYEAGALSDGTSWFAMELVEGASLTEHCHAHVPTLAGRLSLFRTVCEAVQHAHRHLIVHRDLKPSNIIVTPAGQLKLLDFGIAKQLDAEEHGAADRPGRRSAKREGGTVTALRLMTPAYAAPEQFRGGHIGVHTDVYALGVILYELLANRRPFDLAEKSASEAERIILDQDPPRPSSSTHRVSGSRSAWPDLDVLCLTAMHKEPARRYATVDALIRDIDHFVRREPLDARPDSWRYRGGKFIRRHWQAVAATAATLTVLVGLTAVYTLRVTEARQAAEAEAVRTARIQGFMLNLFDGGDASAGPADDLRVLTLIDRGAQEARALDAEPLVQAELYRTIGGLYQKIGRFDRADALLTSALERHRGLMGDDAAPVGDDLVAIGLLRIDQARFEDAERLIGDGLALARRGSGSASPAAARALAAHGHLLEARGAYDEAIGVNEQAVNAYAQLGEGSAEWTAALGQLADSHYYAGHYEQADRLNDRVLASTRAIYGGQHPRVADILVNLGASQSDRGRYEDAKRFYRPALDILREYYGDDHFRTASAKTMLGRTLVYQKEFAEGVPLLEQALAVQQQINGPTHPRVASALNDLGSAALQQKRLDEAAARFSRMIEIYRTVYGGDHYLLATAISNLGSVHVEKADYAGAERLYRDAVDMFTRVQSATHLNTGIARLKLGRALLRQQRYQEAEPHSRAGYDIVRAQANPSIGFLNNARTDLAAEYEALGETEKATAMRAELEMAAR